MTKKAKPQKKTLEREDKENILLKEIRGLQRQLDASGGAMYSAKDNKGKAANVAWALFSTFIRRRDMKEQKGTCYTCGKSFDTWKDSQAGHYLSRSMKATLFDERQVKSQCAQCNNPSMGAGRPREFAYRLVLEYGADILTDLKKKSMQDTKVDFYFWYDNAKVFAKKLDEM